ncbi:D-alanyl-D-alanine carboxypeptidase/D-alanyl-D-alanine-endopeptidase [Fodinibius halophilus]|uniref:Peptidase S13 n=1 Tax=Fodinibius halophilus TaxID=1736908 RepID=A0A6M1T8Q4_9BACT|nr:D-alanyl-D-alanine carboxypeptidase [Fodinibius halophilus]NGP89805.1 hypothetical protein [Fodinibius halophilus]
MKLFRISCFIFGLGMFMLGGCQTTETIVETTTKKSKSPFAVMFDTSKVFSSNLTGFALYDPQEDTLIYGHNEGRYFTPASNTKLFTFYAGLKLLPDSIRALEYVVRGDSLIFWGTGDPSFLHPEFGNGSVYQFLKNREEQLYYSDSNFKSKRFGPGWAWDDSNYYYQTEKSPLPMYGNTATFTIEEVKRRQVVTTDSGLAVSPPIFRSYINKEVKKIPNDPILFRGFTNNEFEYKPQADTKRYTIDKPYHYTPELITDMLTDTLGKSVTYLRDITKPDSAQVIYSIKSDTAYKRMLLPSDNFIAEQLLLVAAAELGNPLNSDSTIEKMSNEYFDVLPDKPQWVDGSGLSRYNMFTPRSIIHLLWLIDDEFTEDKNLFHLFPAGGESGTIKDWYLPAEGDKPYVFAKTGTLSNNHSLSGYLITESGRKLIFSFMNNHYVTSTSVVKEEMEKILRFIHSRL